MCSLVVVLERRTLVHDLKTLELLRTLESPANPKVWGLMLSLAACRHYITTISANLNLHSQLCIGRACKARLACAM